MAFLDNTGVTRLVTDLKARFAAITHNHAASDITSGTLPIARGGTGASTHTSNAVLTGNGTSAVNNVATADGALYATAANGAAQFGTLPIAQGGTGATTAAGAVENVVDGQALAPASVAATGEVSAKSGTTTHKLTEKAQDTRADNLEASIAPVESVTATANHAVGDYFMLGDVLMKATAAIATGETISTSNATPATVQSQIDALRDSVSVSPSITYQSGFSQRAAGFYVHNCVLYFAFGINHANTLNGNTTYTVATMPTGFRPKLAFSAVDVFNGAFVNIGINVDGAVTAFLSTQKTAGWFWVRGCYLLA